MITDEYRTTLETELATLGKRADEIMGRLSEVEFGPLRSDGDGAATEAMTGAFEAEHKGCKQ